ncbi:hypothetical protein pb186bvf_016155 [Paramecium bursaria]
MKVLDYDFEYIQKLLKTQERVQMAKWQTFIETYQEKMNILVQKKNIKQSQQNQLYLETCQQSAQAYYQDLIQMEKEKEALSHKKIKALKEEEIANHKMLYQEIAKDQPELQVSQYKLISISNRDEVIVQGLEFQEKYYITIQFFTPKLKEYSSYYVQIDSKPELIDLHVTTPLDKKNIQIATSEGSSLNSYTIMIDNDIYSKFNYTIDLKTQIRGLYQLNNGLIVFMLINQAILDNQINMINRNKNQILYQSNQLHIQEHYFNYNTSELYIKIPQKIIIFHNFQPNQGQVCQVKQEIKEDVPLQKIIYGQIVVNDPSMVVVDKLPQQDIYICVQDKHVIKFFNNMTRSFRANEFPCKTEIVWCKYLAKFESIVFSDENGTTYYLDKIDNHLQ